MISLYNHQSGEVNGTASSLTININCGSSPGILLVGVNNNGGTPSSVTFSGSNMTALTSVSGLYIYYLVNPSLSGNNNVVASFSGNLNGIGLNAAYYTGIFSSGQPYSYTHYGSPTFSYNGSAYVGTLTGPDTISYYDDWVHGFFTIHTVGGSYQPTFASNYSITDGQGPYGDFYCGQLTTNGSVEPPSITETLTSTQVGATGYGMDLIVINLRRAPLSLTGSASESIMNSAARYSSVGAGSVPTKPPIVTMRQKTYPFGIFSSILNYIKTSLIGTILPVLNNEDSDSIYIRIYNNFQGGQHVADALNVSVTTWDGNSLTASMAVASQGWMHIQQSGWGEGSSGGALYTQFLGFDRPIGGTEAYSADYSSNGTPGVSEIRSASNFPGAGFIELKTYILPKSGNVGMVNNFVLSVNYEYSL